ncbi:MAG TPA: PAS domain-containing protein, partial [Pyrodictium sp.]|nr:PAS domain-containing protein [Pyrodictium sp.]
MASHDTDRPVGLPMGRVRILQGLGRGTFRFGAGRRHGQEFLDGTPDRGEDDVMPGHDIHDKNGGCTPSCEEIVDILPEPFMVIGRDYRIVATNAAYRRHYGVSAEEVVGRRCHEVSHRSPVPCSQNGEHCPLEEVLARGEPFQVIHTHFDARGRRERVQLQAVPIRDAAGEVRFIGEYIHPIVERPLADELLVGRSARMLQLVSLLQRVAPTRTTVLLLGESGVGKEQAAKYVHHYSSRAEGPFVVVDCGTLGEQLIESELFGYEKGAFTGATSAKKGLFEAAEGGTLFIDEICELPLPLQTKLLRVLETGMVRRVGGTEYRQVDVRVIAATNRDIQAMVAEGRFR